MILKQKEILLLSAVVLFLILYPYSKKVENFRANDVNWDILNHTKKFKEFDYKSLAFRQNFEFSEDVLKMNGKEITIKGFIKKHKHGKHTDIILTETVTDVCFMCDHDEHYNMMLLKDISKKSKIKSLKDDTYAEIKGVFKINKNAHSVYVLENSKLVSVCKKKQKSLQEKK